MNKYKYLNRGCRFDLKPVEATASWELSQESEERVRIDTAMLPDGDWVYGYQVYWKNGQVSVSPPVAANGCFASQRDAQLYAIGYMLCFRKYFQPASDEALRRAELKLLQTEFDFEK